MASYDFVFLFGALFLIQKIDFTVPENITYALITFIVTQLACILSYALIYKKVSSLPDGGSKIDIKTPASLAGPEKIEKMTIKEYDMSQVKKVISQVAMSAGIPLFLFYKWSIVPPLAMNCLFGPQNLYKNKLFKIYILGEDQTKYPRPWTEENPFAGLMGGQNQDAAATTTTSDSQDDDNDTVDGNGNIRLATVTSTTTTAPAPKKNKNKNKIVEVDGEEISSDDEKQAKKSPLRSRKVD